MKEDILKLISILEARNGFNPILMPHFKFRPDFSQLIEKIKSSETLDKTDVSKFIYQIENRGAYIPRLMPHFRFTKEVENLIKKIKAA